MFLDIRELILASRFTGTVTTFEYQGVSNHRRIDCFLKLTAKKISRFALLGLYGGIPPMTDKGPLIKGQ